jgi:pyroglutamyl-peptidase
MLQAIRDAGIAAELSNSAGTFVCNHVFYALMHALASKRSLRLVRGGFVHVPWLPEQGEPSMPLEAMVRGLSAALRSAITTTTTDAAVADGALH